MDGEFGPTGVGDGSHEDGNVYPNIAEAGDGMDRTIWRDSFRHV